MRASGLFQRVVAFTFAAFFAVSLALAETGPNLFSNANFDDEAGLAATGWITGGGAKLGTGTTQTVPTDAIVSKPYVVQISNASSIRQTVNVSMGTYEVGFNYSAGTPWGNRHNMRIFVDGQPETELVRATTAASKWQILSVTKNLSAGPHEFVFDFLNVHDIANMAIDDAFLWKVGDLTGTLQVVGEPQAFALDGVPVYGFHQLETGVATTFTAPSRIDLNADGSCYVQCLGYRVDTFDEQNQTWILGTPVQGVTHYEIARADDANRRLAWLFEKIYYFNPTHVWNGKAGDGDFDNKDNWETRLCEPVAAAPDSTSIVFIPAPDGEVETTALTVNGPFHVAGFYAGRLGTSKGKVSVTMAHGGDNVIDGDCTLFPGVTLTHAEETVTSFSAVGYRVNLVVGGDMVLSAGSFVDVQGRGFDKKTPSGQGGHNSANDYGAAHGGRTRSAVTTPAVNDSCHFPTNFGAGGFFYRGGGAVHLAVTGTLTANGDINADSVAGIEYSGSGGAIWLSAGALAGAGKISANGSTYGSSCGSGGRIAVHQTEAGDFTAFTGEIQARCVSSSVCRAPGTIYLRSAGQELGEGTLIVENGGATTGYGRGAELTENELAFGTVIVTNGARLFVRSDQTLKIRDRVCTLGGGVITNAAGSAMDFSFATNLLFQGVNLFSNFIYTNKTGVLRFGTEEGSQFGTYDGGSVFIQGDAENRPTLCPAEPSGFWRMHLGVGSDARSVIKYAAVSNSLAAGGESVSAVNCTDLGGNDSYWGFMGEVLPGDPITWNGSADSVWGNAANWTDKDGVHRTPQATDCVTIPAHCNDQPVSNFPILAAGVTDAHTLEVEQGATLTLDGGSLRCDESLAVAGTLTCVGGETLVVSNAMTVTGTLNAGRAFITCYGPAEVTGALATSGRALLTFCGNVSLGASTYAAPLATFRLASAGEQAVTLSENAFFAFEVAKTGGGVTFADGFSADALTLGTTGAAAVLTFASGRTVTCGDFFACGMVDAAAGLALLASAGDPWLLKATGGNRLASGVAVTNCDARAGGAILADAFSVGENAQGWQFGENVGFWTGAANSSWKNPANWAAGVVPPEGASVCISAARTDLAVTLDEAASLREIVFKMDGEAKLSFSVSAALALSETLEVPADVTLTANKPIVTAGDFILRAGATLTHAGPGNPPGGRVDLTADGAVTFEPGATVTVSGMGYARGSGPGSGGNSYGPVASHAGWYDWSDYKPAYGSILSPSTWGSGGFVSGPTTAGGGAIRIASGGTLTLGCDVTADSFDDAWMSGTGGSVSLTCGTLVGPGNVSVRSGTSTSTYAGSGGRIAIVQTVAKDFAAWTGRAWAGNSGQTSLYLGGPGTIYTKSAGGHGRIEIANGAYKASSYTDFPMADDGDAAKVYRDTALVVSSNATVYLTADATVYDLDLASEKSYVNLNGHTLTVLNSAHRNGRRWGAPYETLVKEDGGKIVWKGGFALIIR